MAEKINGKNMHFSENDFNFKQIRFGFDLIKFIKTNLYFVFTKQKKDFKNV